jgi:DNA-directed RNA polymerase II subunit RPB1
MNLHMPQDIESESELKNLAAVPYQIISPANNSSIIGIYQDSMLGCYQFTRENISFSIRDAMNLLMMFNKVNEFELLSKGKLVTNFDILTQIMPPMSIKYNTKLFNEEKDDIKTSNYVLEIKNGKYMRGQMDKQVLGGTSKGLLHRICNDFGNMASSDFIDDLQNIITEYMKSSAFSVGISDLISNEVTKQDIVEIITNKKTEVQSLIQQTQIGIFENNTGKTNEEEFETRVNNILNQASSESGKKGLKSLNKNNRFVTMVNAGSKGSDLNISFMISCLGQQNVDGKRIPYGFEHRTLPHFTKFDDSPGARGFVESSYINGLTPQEVFFHAMGGRVGLIDTAVKTSSTGYIQRKLIKGLEDLMINYDMTVRNNMNKIVQFRYGDDGFDTIKVENQIIHLLNMSIQDIYAHFNPYNEHTKPKDINKIFIKSVATRLTSQLEDFKKVCKKYTDFMIEMRNDIIKHVFKYKKDLVVNLPVAFVNIINNIQGQTNLTSTSIVDLTLYEAFQLIDDCYLNLEKIYYSPPTNLFKTLYYFYLCPKELLIVKRFNRSALILLLNTITLTYKKAIVTPGEMVGMISGQSIGEVSTQMTLNTFHFAGVASKSNVTRGVPRIEEILSLSSNPKNPSMTIYLKEEDETDKEKVNTIMTMLEHTKLEDVVKSVEICFDPDDLNTLIKEDEELIQQFMEFENMMNGCGQNNNDENYDKTKWLLRLELDSESMLEKNITMDDINFTLNNSFEKEIHCIYSDYNSDKLIFRIRMKEIIKNSSSRSGVQKKITKSLDQSDQIYLLKNFQDQLLKRVILRGINKINKVILRKIKDNLIEKNGSYEKQDIWVLDTIGTNMLEVLALDYIDNKRTFSNDIIEIYEILGIEAARQIIYNELAEVIEFDGTYINYHNFSLLCDRMTFTSKLISITRFGVNSDNIGPIAKASFEETPEMFLNAARYAEIDNMRGISANVMCGQEGYFGTSCFQVFVDIEEMRKLQETTKYEYIDEDEEIEKFFDEKQDSDDACSLLNLQMQNMVINIHPENIGNVNTDYNPGF